MVFFVSSRLMVTRPFIAGFSTRLLVHIFTMGISIPEETIVAVKLSGGDASTEKPVNKMLAMKKNDTRYLMLTFAIIPSSLFLRQDIISLLPIEVCFSY
jgi:hypothetical protein